MKIRVDDSVLKDYDRKIEQLERKIQERWLEIANLQEENSKLEFSLQEREQTRILPDLSSLVPYLALLNQKSLQSDPEIQRLLRSLVIPILQSLQPEKEITEE